MIFYYCYKIRTKTQNSGNCQQRTFCLEELQHIGFFFCLGVFPMHGKTDKNEKCREMSIPKYIKYLTPFFYPILLCIPNWSTCPDHLKLLLWHGHFLYFIKHQGFFLTRCDTNNNNNNKKGLMRNRWGWHGSGGVCEGKLRGKCQSFLSPTAAIPTRSAGKGHILWPNSIPSSQSLCSTHCGSQPVVMQLKWINCEILLDIK